MELAFPVFIKPELAVGLKSCLLLKVINFPETDRWIDETEVMWEGPVCWEIKNLPHSPQ